MGQKHALEVLENVFEPSAGLPSCIAINLFPIFTHDTIGAHARINIRTGINVTEEPTRKLAVLPHADVIGSTALVQLNARLLLSLINVSGSIRPLQY